MPKKPARKRPSKRPPTRWRLLRLVPAAAAAAGVFAAVWWAGRLAGAEVAGHERYAVRAADLRVNPPAGVERAKFVAEVRVLGGLPETVSAVDPNLPAVLGEAFRLHPWVDDVLAVAAEPDGGVRVEVRYRTPALAIRWNGASRAVTAAGVLLPAGTDTAGLPVLRNERTITAAADGRPWPEADVRRAAELAARHGSKAVERTRTGWRLTDADGTALVIDGP